jgi:flagellar biosynthesis/type III secretory pathway protein FliH
MQLRRRALSASMEGVDWIEDLLEGHAMLEQTIERWFDEATLKGVQQGVQQGIQQGYVKALSLQLRLRFGALPAWAEERLAQASEEELLGWMGGLLSATTLEDLMAQPQG